MHVINLRYKRRVTATLRGKRKNPQNSFGGKGNGTGVNWQRHMLDVLSYTLVHVRWRKAFLLPCPLCPPCFLSPFNILNWMTESPKHHSWVGLVLLVVWTYSARLHDATQLSCFLNRMPILWLCIYYLVSSCYRDGTSPKTMRPLNKLKPDKEQGHQGICILLPTPFLWALEFLSRYSPVRSHILPFLFFFH